MARPSPSPTLTTYLASYNLLSAVLWAGVLALTLTHLSSPSTLHRALDPLPRYVQSLAALEILHSLFGLIRSPLPTTVLQVSSRLLLTWGVAHAFPTVARGPAYATMLLAWSATEVVRYPFYVFRAPPPLLTWLRYNTFFVLYPVGVVSEMCLLYAALDPAGSVAAAWRWAFVAVLVVYPPGFYVMFTHMMRQRRKVLRGKAPVRD